MIEINNKRLCENCFAETGEEVCPHCGYCKASAESNDQILSPGSVLNGKYIVGKSLGSGGFGITYLGYSVFENKKVAIKEYFPKTIVYRKSADTTVRLSRGDHTVNFEKGREAFYKEANTVSRFNGNPNIVSVYEFFFENDTAYFVMEYLEGRDLKQYVASRGSNLNSKETREMMISIASALFITHTLDVLHRDVSNVNIFVCNDGTYKLIDFGSARQYSMERTQSMSVILNPGFAPLEQYQRHGKQGPWTDIYSLGATAYWALTGELLDDPMTRLSGDKLVGIKGTDIDPGLYKIICKCISVDAKERYQDIPALLRDLTQKPTPKPIIKYAAISAAVVAVITAGAVLIAGALNKDEPSWTPPDYESSAPSDAESEAPTEVVGETPTEAPTEAPTEGQTEAPTEKQTEAPTERHTEAPTEKQTEAPTEKQTEAPTEKQTEAPTEKQTEAPTEKQTEAPTEKQTEAPTETPTDQSEADRLYESGQSYYNNGEYENALSEFLKSAELGNANAMNTIGNMYYYGRGVRQHYGEAFKWFNAAAELGHDNAMNNLGYMYQNGLGVERDPIIAMIWYVKSAELGNATAMNNAAFMFHYGYGVTRDYTAALEWFLRAAEYGSGVAMNNIGRYYEFGYVVSQDYDTALEWYEKATAAGYDSDEDIARVKEKMNW